MKKKEIKEIKEDFNELMIKVETNRIMNKIAKHLNTTSSYDEIANYLDEELKDFIDTMTE